MALLWINGFDHYQSSQSQSADKWHIAGGGAIYTTSGRWGGGCLRLYAHDYRDLRIPPRNTVYIGFAFWATAFSGFIYSDPLLYFVGPLGTDHVRISGDSDGDVRAWGPGGTTLGDSDGSGKLKLGSGWCYFEVMVKIGDSDGAVHARINEQTILNLTNVDTKAASEDALIGKIGVHAPYYTNYGYYDDMYVDDAQFHGNVRVRTFYPDSDGVHSDWTRSAGANDYECVDEALTNEDTDYIKTTTKGHKSTFGITTGELPTTVKGVQVNHHLKANASGIRRMHPLVRSGGADYRAPITRVIPSSDYGYRWGIFENDPQDSNPWNQTKLEAAEFGLELMHGTTTTSTSTTTTTT